MAMMKCPHCGAQISERALKCPFCWFELATESQDNGSVFEPIICTECGAAFSKEKTACPACGCPAPAGVEQGPGDTSQSAGEAQSNPGAESAAGAAPQSDGMISIHPAAKQGPDEATRMVAGMMAKEEREKKQTLTKAALLVVIVFVAGLIGLKILSDRRAAEAREALQTYIENLNQITSEIYYSALKAEQACGLFHDVWQNCILEKRDFKTDPYTRPNGHFESDFNFALNNLINDSNYISKVSYIQSSRDSIESTMDQLKDPPEECQEAYEVLKDLYSAYLDLTDLVTNPTGSLISYTEAYNSADSDVAECYDDMKRELIKLETENKAKDPASRSR